MKRYNLINNSLGWLCFVIAAVTYLLTLEPTASFWDCPEFITQGYKLEVGHPPGNPIFMLTARFFINFVGSDPSSVAVAVNAMNGLLSAATIMLLFWTVTHLMRRLLTGYKPLDEISTANRVVIFASGLVGALAYAWSDTFWYSAVEGEVYAFSSFCTALVFWLILKWENHADEPRSDRYLILMAYVIGVSIAVHLLNLLCIPAIVLVYYFRKYSRVNFRGSCVALLVSFAIVGVILYGLVPGFVEVSQYFELFCVNTLGMPYNVGVLIYALLTIGVFIWSIFEFYRRKSPAMMRLSFLCAVIVSGIPFIGSSMLLTVVIILALTVWLFVTRTLPVRLLGNAGLCLLVIFIGYSSYALLLIRASADVPVNQNAPNNVFALASYLNREQYGQNPLFYGTTFNSEVKRTPGGEAIYHDEYTYAQALPDENGNHVVRYDKVKKELGNSGYEYVDEMNMLFPRMYDSRFAAQYKSWGGFTDADMEEVTYKNYDYIRSLGDYGEVTRKGLKPTFRQNFSYFVNYQLIHMYFRYFMWNFAGRQNDLQNSEGEPNRGNWISGFDAWDSSRLGDQSLLPPAYSTGNKGHNVYYMLPLLLGLFGLVWQSLRGQEGIRQFWVVFFLFFMTGIAIVLYLNQTPDQPRERDYAFAGSFYAFAIWIGLGVGALARSLSWIRHKVMGETTDETGLPCAIAASLLCMIVPVQMLSQNWDDHDRSGRYTARDFGMNYLASLEPNAIIFTNGDNDTFPLWYAQEVEGFRRDVRVINLSYLTTDWYAAQQLLPAYDAKPVNVLANLRDFGHDRRKQGYVPGTSGMEDITDVRDFLSFYYSDEADKLGELYGISIPTSRPVSMLTFPNPGESDAFFGINLADALAKAHQGSPVITLADALILDIIGHSAANGWNRPVYFANTVPNEMYLGLDDYMHNTGMAKKVTGPLTAEEEEELALKAYRNFTDKFRWGGLDAADGDDVYLDETVQRMVISTRYAMLETAENLCNVGHYDEAYKLLRLMEEKLPTKSTPYGIQIGQSLANLYRHIGEHGNIAEAREDAVRVLGAELDYFARFMPWLLSMPASEFNSLRRSADYDRPVLLSSYSSSYGVNIPYSYFNELVRDYLALAGEERANARLTELSAKTGVDLIKFCNDFRVMEDNYFLAVDSQQHKPDELHRLFVKVFMKQRPSWLSSR